MPDSTHAHSLESITKALQGLDRPGDFFGAGAIEAAPPLLEVGGAGIISFPVQTDQARTMIAEAAERAPYGRGDETLVDESVRKVWQISPEKIHLGGRQWPSTLDVIVSRATEALGRPDGSLIAELYKLLIYDEGGFFQAHRDTEKSPGMLGTLIVVLPSLHEDGELVVRHDGRETVQDLRTVDPGELRYAAFYADCEHEVRPVSRGHRVCLVYNLVMTARARGGQPTVPDTRPQVEAVSHILRAWADREDRASKIVYLLEHRYTEAALSFSALKGPDAVLADVFRKAADACDCALHLAMVHIEESGWAEHTGGFGRRRRRGRRYYADEDEGEDDFEIGEVCEIYRYIDQWRDSANRSVDYGEIPLEAGELLPEGVLDDEDADEIHFSEATGNEGASFERTYLRAALVIWPQASFDKICASAGMEATVARLEQRVAEAASGKNTDEAAAGVRKLTELFADHWSRSMAPREACGRVIRTLVDFGNPDLLARFVAPILSDRLPGDHQCLLDWAGLAGSKGFHPIARDLFDRKSRMSAVQAIELWTGLCDLWCDESDGATLDELLSSILEKIRDTAFRNAPVDDDDDNPDELDADFRSIYRPTRKVPVVSPPATLIRFLRSAENGPAGKRVDEALARVLANDLTFSVLETILPSLEMRSADGSSLSEATRDTLWRHCADSLLARAATPPSPPTDWALPLSEGQLARLSANLRDFALDPDNQVLRLRKRKDLRQEVHRMIDAAGLDMTHVTERKGSPYTLVCTKTFGHYERSCRQYEQDYNGLSRLAALPEAAARSNRKRHESLAAAIRIGEGWSPVPAQRLPLPNQK